MSKILLVEDDNNLREIYEARLQAEGYDIVSARDGEEALVVAKGEHPDLIISDVMMPKISGFEMLDILRNAEDLRDVKVIMLTALGQAEDQKRADSLGADRYLVKSQVTLEDIVRVSQELLTQANAATADQTAAAAEAPAAAAEAVAPVAVQPEPVQETASEPLTSVADSEATPEIPVATAPTTSESPMDVSPQMPPTVASTIPEVPAAATESTDEPQTSAQEEQAVEAQIADFVSSQPTAPSSTDDSTTTTPEQEQALNDALTSLGGVPEATPSVGEAAPVAEPSAVAPAPTPPEAVPPVPPIKQSSAAVMPRPVATEEAPASEPAARPSTRGDEDDIPVHRSKVIQPLSSSDQGPKKSLDVLLAEQDAKDSGLTLPATPPPNLTLNANPASEPAIPESPTEITPDTFNGTTPAAPQAGTATPPNAASSTDFDPNSIAL